MAEEQLNLLQKLAKIRKMTEVIQKNKKGFNYRYTSIDEILARVTAGMDKYGVSLVPRVVQGSENVIPYQYEKTKFTKDGKQYAEQINEIITQTSMVYRWINNDNPDEFLEVPWFIVGSQQDPAQAFGSGLTYGLRQFMIQFFQIATLDDEDPDSWRSKQKDAEAMEGKLIAEKIIEEVNTLVNSIVAEHPEQRDNIIAITKKHVKVNGKPSGNYLSVTDPKVASELLEAIKSGINIKESKENKQK